MILTLLQISAFAAAAICLYRWRVGVRRRNLQTWESLLCRLRPGWGAHEQNDQILWEKGLEATPEENWQRIQGPHGLWAMHQNARVMLEIADYAARNTASIDRNVIDALRSDAMHIRICVLKALVLYAFNQAHERTWRNAFCAVSIYTEMASRMADLMQVNFAGMFPSLAF
jgi:hypothetical protein